MFSKIFKSLIQHKFITLVSLLMIITGGYFGYQGLTKDEDTVQYVTAAVEKGTIISSVSGSGQVSASDQVDVKAKVSGDVVYVGVKNGQEVKAGALLAQIDSRDAQKAVRDAETALETAQLELEKLLEPVGELDLLKAENDLAQAGESKEEAEDAILEGYEDAFNEVVDAFLDLPTLITGLKDILVSSQIAESEPNISNYSDNTASLKNSVYDSDEKYELEKFIDNAIDNYTEAREKYNQNLDNYEGASRYSSHEIIEDLLEETLETVRAMSDLAKSETHMLDYWVDYRSSKNMPIYSQVSQYQSDLNSYTSTINNHLSNLLAIQRSLQSNREAVLNAQRSIEELELSFKELKAGADDLDIRAKQITIRQKEDALLDAQQGLADHYIRAPFDGLVAEVSVKKGESISSGVVATLITKQKIAEITINEIDTAVVKIEQKVTITFDAVEDLAITGEVAEIDALGTVSQGVVTYDVKIIFDTQDERVKPGMSMSASIITEMKQNVIMVSNSAIKSESNQQYIEILENGNIQRQQIEAGLSNDLYTEITSGVEEGAQVIVGQSSVSEQNSGGPPEGMQMMRIMR